MTYTVSTTVALVSVSTWRDQKIQLVIGDSLALLTPDEARRIARTLYYEADRHDPKPPLWARAEDATERTTTP